MPGCGARRRAGPVRYANLPTEVVKFTISLGVAVGIMSVLVPSSLLLPAMLGAVASLLKQPGQAPQAGLTRRIDDPAQTPAWGFGLIDPNRPTLAGFTAFLSHPLLAGAWATCGPSFVAATNLCSPCQGNCSYGN